MKIVKINNNLKINIEQIYSLEHIDNSEDIRDWEKQYNDLMNEYADDPPMLAIDDSTLYKPQYGVENDKESLDKYYEALNEHILEILGIKPQYIEKYNVILSTGLKINVSKLIYDKIDKILDNYLI